MITISAFADEIAPDLKVQMDTCQSHGIRCIDVRAIDGKNVSQMSLQQARQYKRQMDDRGFTVPCIGSPIGKIRLDENFEAHLELLKHCCDVARVFGTSLIRIFSFYPVPGTRIVQRRGEVMERMAAMVELAEQADVILMHENDKAIYGATTEGVKDLFNTIKSPHFKGIFDPANFIAEGIAPYDEAWQCGLADLTDYFHVKDKDSAAAETCVPAGRGRGQFQEIFADLKLRNWRGYMTLEPHMAMAGRGSGFTGPELFAEAGNALKDLCDRAGIPYE